MIGGDAIEVLIGKDRVWINCQDRPVRTPPNKHNTCAIYVKRDRNSERVQVGDGVWWHGRVAYWTPKGSTVEDIPLVRIGYSGADHPAQKLFG